jgi:hypothetical protein
MKSFREDLLASRLWRLDVKRISTLRSALPIRWRNYETYFETCFLLYSEFLLLVATVRGNNNLVRVTTRGKRRRLSTRVMKYRCSSIRSVHVWVFPIQVIEFLIIQGGEQKLVN